MPLGDVPQPLGTGGCEAASYPEGPFGIDTGDVVEGALTWNGLPENAMSGQAVTIAIDDYFARGTCDGSRALVVADISFNDESTALNDALATQVAGPWAELGVRVLLLIIIGGMGEIPDFADAQSWRMQHDTPFAVAADPTRHFTGGAPSEPPIALVLDPCSMAIAQRFDQPPPPYDALFAAVEAVAGSSCAQ